MFDGQEHKQRGKFLGLPRQRIDHATASQVLLGRGEIEAGAKPDRGRKFLPSDRTVAKSKRRFVFSKCLKRPFVRSAQTLSRRRFAEVTC